MRMKKLAVMAMAAALSVGSVMTASAAWLQEGGNWKYQNDNGTYQTGTWFQDADGKWYHFDNNGNMQKGWFLDADGKWYFMAYHGAMQTGLIKVDNQVYYMNPSGELFIGEMAINGITYTFGLYGTTNGQPYVSKYATFGGSGSQSWETGSSHSNTQTVSGSATVGSQAELEQALEQGKKSITFKTDAKEEIAIDGNYASTTFTVDAPLASVTNSAKFDSIVIKSISQNTWTEEGSGNTIKLLGNAHIENNGGSLNVNVESAVSVRLGGTSTTPLVLNINKSNSVVTMETPATVNIKAPVILAVKSGAVAGSSLNVPQAVDGKIQIRSAGEAGSEKLNMNVNGKSNVETAIPTKIIVGTESKVSVAVTSSAAAEGVSVKAASEKYNTAVDNVANGVVNQSSTPVTVEVEKADGSTTSVDKANVKTIEDVIDANVEMAVGSAKSSSYIRNATKAGNTITVELTSTATLLEAEGAAKSIYEMFLCPEVQGVKIGSTEINDSGDLRKAAIALGLKGGNAVKDASKIGTVTVVITTSEGSSVTYDVIIQ